MGAYAAQRPHSKRIHTNLIRQDFLRLFNWLVGQWGAVHSATPSQVAIYRHEMKYRMSMAVQLKNAEALRPGAELAFCAAYWYTRTTYKQRRCCRRFICVSEKDVIFG